MKHALATFTTIALTCFSLSTLAQGSSSSAGNERSGGPGGRPPGPPPEAVAACKGKSEGSEVSFTGRNGETLTGTCRSFDGQLAAMPKGGPGGRGGQPPSR